MLISCFYFFEAKFTRKNNDFIRIVADKLIKYCPKIMAFMLLLVFSENLKLLALGFQLFKLNLDKK